ncbi:hypothetical protein GIB67_000997 [Kingdonia uniflora]|uniref:Cytochrome P450 n=1 Tax=Kingdonia uniflora TaxID=39325 RepID=A0A7J7MG89_9MAGN|nr:hypothetical protein GIB67_000997 [Kingdonia uniflora]
MEFQLFFIFSFVILLFLFIVMKKRGKKAQLPPGPWRLPIIGNAHQLMHGLPHQSLRDLANKYGPLMRLRLGEVSAIVISSPKMAEEVMKTQGLAFVDRPAPFALEIISYNCSDVAFAPYGAYWRHLRKICVLELLSTKRVQSFRLMREEEVSNLIGNISLSISRAGAGFMPVINLSEKVFSLTNDITSRAAFGEKCKDKHVFLSTMKQVLTFASGFHLADLFPSIKFLHVISGAKPKIEKLQREIDSILNVIIKEHKENKMWANTGESEEDLVDVLLRVQDASDLDFPITADNIKAVILDIFTAGSDTPAIAVEWAMSELMRNPREMEKVQTEVRQVFNGKLEVDEAHIHELSYLKVVIKESLRLHPPLPLLLPRECRERCKINGYEIPEKSKVIVNAWAVGRDPECWKDAESFTPERFVSVDVDYKGTNFELIPFGAGRRICPGISFAVAIMELLLAQLLYHFDWSLPNGIKPEELDMTEANGSSLRRKNDLYLVPTLYCNLSVKKDE